MSVKILRAHNGKYSFSVEAEYGKELNDLRVYSIGREYQFQVRAYLSLFRILTVISPKSGELCSVFCGEILLAIGEPENKHFE